MTSFARAQPALGEAVVRYDYCHAANLNGPWLAGPHSTYADGVKWMTWTGYYESLTFTEMKVR